jgi:hypothetical protein
MGVKSVKVVKSGKSVEKVKRGKSGEKVMVMRVEKQLEGTGKVELVR